jgi:hypothetical protein
LTHFLNFSDSASTGQNNPLKCSLITCNPSTGNITATSFNGSLVGNSSTASRIEITDDNSNITYYIPFCSGVGTSQQLLIDSITRPLSYNPSTSAISATSLSSNSINTTGTSLCNLWFQVATGSLNIMSGAQTTGSINIGSTTCTTGLLNVRCPLVLARQIQTTNSTSYPPNLGTHLGYTVQTLGASFTTTSLLANTNTNLFSYAFTSANYGTYLFSAIVALSPTDNTVSRQLILSISQTSATVSNTPFIDISYTTANVGYSYLKVQGVIQIYTGTPTIYLVAYCLGSAANVQTINSLSHFSYTRIA